MTRNQHEPHAPLNNALIILYTRLVLSSYHTRAPGFRQIIQEAQLPQRNSASAAHMEGAKPSTPLPLPRLATPMHTVESEARNKRTSSVPSVKRTLS